MESLEALFQNLWDDYSGINKQAKGIHKLLLDKGEQVANDHIAFRTFNDPRVGIDVLAKSFVNFGYEPKGKYTFTEKKLAAKHFEHENPDFPRIFISELKVEAFSDAFKKVVQGLIDQVTLEMTQKWDFCVSGAPWKPISFETYEQLKTESEYAAWLAVFGFRANHFTVYFNSLKSFKDLTEFNQFIKDSGYELLASGGEIKGTAKDFLEQSSTKAHPVKVQFADCEETIPACYYEFARRYPLPDGKIFSGFIAKSADKIFESTDNK